MCSHVRPHFTLEATQEVGVITPICQLGKQGFGANELQGLSCAAWRVAGAPYGSPLSPRVLGGPGAGPPRPGWAWQVHA